MVYSGILAVPQALPVASVIMVFTFLLARLLQQQLQSTQIRLDVALPRMVGGSIQLARDPCLAL